MTNRNESMNTEIEVQAMEVAQEPTREDIMKERMQLGFQMFEFEMEKREQAIKVMTAKDFPEACNKADASKAKKLATQVKYISSKELEAYTGKQHAHILRDIRVSLEAFEEYTAAEGDDPDLDDTDFIKVLDKARSTKKMEYISHYLLSPDAVEHVLSGYDPVRRMKLIKGLKRLAKLYAQKAAECAMTKRDAKIQRIECTDALQQTFIDNVQRVPSDVDFKRLSNLINVMCTGLTAAQRDNAYSYTVGRDALEARKRALVGAVEGSVASWLSDDELVFWVLSDNGPLFDWAKLQAKIKRVLPRIKDKVDAELTAAQRIGLNNLD